MIEKTTRQADSGLYERLSFLAERGWGGGWFATSWDLRRRVNDHRPSDPYYANCFSPLVFFRPLAAHVSGALVDAGVPGN